MSDRIPTPPPVPAPAPQAHGGDPAVASSPARPGVAAGVIIGATLILVSTALPWIVGFPGVSGMPISWAIGIDDLPGARLTPWLSVATLLIGLGVAALALHRFRWARIATGGLAVAVTTATVWKTLELFGLDFSQRSVGIGPYVAVVGGLVLLFQWRSNP